MQWTSGPNIGKAPLPQRARGYWKRQFSAADEGLEKLLETERTQLPPWFIVGLGTASPPSFPIRSTDSRPATAHATPAYACCAKANGSGGCWPAFVLSYRLGENTSACSQPDVVVSDRRLPCGCASRGSSSIHKRSHAQASRQSILKNTLEGQRDQSRRRTTLGRKRYVSSAGSIPRAAPEFGLGADHSAAARNCGSQGRGESCSPRDGRS